MNKQSYYVSLMRPVYQRALVEVSGETPEEAREQALEKARRFSDQDWAGHEMIVTDSAIVETALPTVDFTHRGEAVAFLGKDAAYSYALLQANVDTGEGDIIAPQWLTDCSELMVADLTADWAAQLTQVHKDGVSRFLEWLKQSKAPANVIDFVAARKRLRPEPGGDDGSQS